MTIVTAYQTIPVFQALWQAIYIHWLVSDLTKVVLLTLLFK